MNDLTDKRAMQTALRGDEESSSRGKKRIPRRHRERGRSGNTAGAHFGISPDPRFDGFYREGGK